MDRLPWAMNANHLTANRVYEGRDYQLIIGWVNPLNEKRKMTIYTAQDVEKVININQVPHGATHYVIARNYMPVKYGNYKRFMNIWVYE